MVRCFRQIALSARFVTRLQPSTVWTQGIDETQTMKHVTEQEDFVPCLGRIPRV